MQYIGEPVHAELRGKILRDAHGYVRAFQASIFKGYPDNPYRFMVVGTENHMADGELLREGDVSLDFDMERLPQINVRVVFGKKEESGA